MGQLEKPVPKEILLLTTIASNFMLFILSSNAVAPRLELPPQIISHIPVVETSGVRDWQQLSLRNRFMLERASRQISQFTPYLGEIGPYGHRLARGI